MKAKNLSILWILVIIACALIGCTTTNSSPGPISPVGPQGPVGPQNIEGPPHDDAIVIENKGRLVSKEYSFTGFEEIEVNSLMTVEISQGEDFKIITEVEEDAVPYLEVSLDGKRLSIGLDPSQAYSMSNATVRAKIMLPEMANLIVDGISHVTLKDFKCTNSGSLVVKGISSLEGMINGCDLLLDVSNLSKVLLSGSAGVVTVRATDISEVDLTSLEMQNLESVIDDSSELIVADN
jgi:hypothetical protein